MSNNDPATASGSDQSADKPKKVAYDYKSSSIEEDRAAALEVEKRVEAKRREEDGKAGKEDDAAMTQQEREDGAARLLQGQYSTYQQRRSKEGRNLSSSDRWTEGMRARKLSEAGKDQAAGVNDSGTGSRSSTTSIATEPTSSGITRHGTSRTPTRTSSSGSTRVMASISTSSNALAPASTRSRSRTSTPNSVRTTGSKSTTKDTSSGPRTISRWIQPSSIAMLDPTRVSSSVARRRSRRGKLRRRRGGGGRGMKERMLARRRVMMGLARVMRRR
ncbi:hypothetical protein BCR35DRAFT_203689 [Leucosporidium creatinivorum]|uniref:Uncharacterized protein n=1 Tax=Leucosporidium creatinivorum TaxID=106004 RepID=A0A1Y2DHU5_9BASI|nr:hypothetical protein BCR35DRAFT_203689 [Leucosporidium creatinivorum]